MSRRPAARGKRLDRDDRCALVRRRQEERVEERVVRRHVSLVADEENVPDDPEVGGELLDRVAVGAVADQAERGLDAAVEQRLEGREDVRYALDRCHAPDPADDEPVIGDAEEMPELRAPVAGQNTRLEVDAETDHRELLGRRHSELDEIVANLGPDGDQPVRVPRERALGLAEELGAQRVEVAAQHVPVVGVDDHRRPRVAREQRGRPADRPRFRRVGVQDVRRGRAGSRRRAA